MRHLWRALARSGWLGLANGLALAAAFAAAILLLGLVHYEMAFNSGLDPAARVQQIYTRVTPPGRPPSVTSGTAADLAAAIRAQRSDLTVGRLAQSSDPQELRVGPTSSFEVIFEADPDIARIFAFQAIAGDIEAALSRPDSAAVTPAMAQKLFGRADVIGEAMTLFGRPYRIEAVIEDLPSNSSLAELGILVSSRGPGTLLYDADRPGPTIAFMVGAVRTYVLTDGALDEIARIVDAHAKAVIDRMQQAAGREGAPGLHVEHVLVGFRDLDAAQRAGAAIDPNRAAPLLLLAMSGLAGLVLIVAALNVVNLSTSQAIKRATSVAVHKAFGASRAQIAGRFLAESALMGGLASLVGLGMAWMLADWFAHLVRRPLSLHLSVSTLALLACAGILTGIAAGLYPALVLSRFQPATVLGARGAQAPGAGLLRRILVAAQVAGSVATIGLSVSVLLQLNHVTQRGLGFQASDVIAYRLPQALAAGDPRVVSLLADLHNAGAIEHVALTEALPTEGRTGSLRASSAVQSGLELTSVAVSPDLIDVLALDVVAGRGFEAHEFGNTRPSGDANRPGPLRPIVISRGAATKLGFATPQAAIHAIVPFGGAKPWNGSIIGVVEDLPMGRLRADTWPDLVLTTDLRAAMLLTVRLSGDASRETIASLDRIYRRYFPEGPLERFFLADRVALAYADVSRLLGLVVFFGALSAGAAGLGVMGMSTASAERMRREAGVRKAFGAPSLAIAGLLLSRLFTPLAVGLVLGALTGWLAAREWLLTFPNRTALNGWPELVASGVVITLALLASGWQVVQLARARPVETLTYE